MVAVEEGVQRHLDRLVELVGAGRGLEGALGSFIEAYEDYGRRHAPPPGRLSEAEAEALASVGVAVNRVGDTTDPGVYVAGLRVAVLVGALSVKEAADRIGVSQARIRQRLTADPPTLLGVRVFGGEWRLPRFQFEAGAAVALRGAEGIAALPHGLPLSRAQALFTQPNDVLCGEDGQGLSPVDWLAEGYDPTPVVDLARSAGMVP